MSGRLPPVDPPRSMADRIARVVMIVSLVLVGLVVGAIAGLFVADWLGWVPTFNLC